KDVEVLALSRQGHTALGPLERLIECDSGLENNPLTPVIEKHFELARDLLPDVAGQLAVGKCAGLIFGKQNGGIRDFETADFQFGRTSYASDCLAAGPAGADGPDSF